MKLSTALMQGEQHLRLKAALLKVYAFLVLLLLLAGCSQKPQLQDVILNAEWFLTGDTLANPLPTDAPADVHSILYANGLIENPMTASHEKQLQWIDQQSWTFSTSFKTRSEWFNQAHVELVFDGVDTYARVYLNDSLLFFADNMFRSWRKDIKPLLNKDANHLRVVFPPIDSIQNQKLTEYGVELPEVRAFTRKAAYQSGWDWSPVYRTVGIWRPLRLEFWNELLFRDAAVLTQKIEPELAELSLEIVLHSETNRALKLQLLHNGRKLIEKPVQLQFGQNSLSIPFEVSNPQLWWPNGSGKQEIYTFSLKLFDGNQEVVQQQIKAGIRTIQLVQQEDRFGKSFAFVVNGEEMYALGANYVPEDNFPVNTAEARTRRLLEDAAAVNMNMLRVWGGGYYQPDYFYEICDSLGLMVWQDFMFANSLYPNDSHFLENVSAEAEEQLVRLRKHPSLALWCGNNEVDEGMKNWGWQKQFGWTDDQQKKLEKGYDTLFNQLLNDKVISLHPTVAYWPSSPSIGWGHPESLLSGDAHYWGVWWGEQAFEVYRKKVGRFNSEFGFQALPDMATLNYIAADSVSLQSADLLAHQKHPRGMQLIAQYMQRDFPVPAVFSDYVYVSQLVQAYGIGMAIEAQRISKPKSMGTLFWQLNDSWPAISWSSVDYFGRWKALHYQLDRLYSPIFIGVEQKSDESKIHLLNETTSEIIGQLQIDLLNFRGDLLHSVAIEVDMNGKTAQQFDMNMLRFLRTIGAEKLLMRVRLRSSNRVLAERHHFFAKSKDLELLPADISMHLMLKNERIQLVLSSDVFVKDLQLSSNDGHGRFSQNYFDLFPGESVSVDFYPSAEMPVENLRFSKQCLNNLIQQE